MPFVALPEEVMAFAALREEFEEIANGEPS